MLTDADAYYFAWQHDVGVVLLGGGRWYWFWSNLRLQ
jgi:hypothetical protein